MMKQTKKIVFAALCMAIGVALPIAFHGIPNSGSIFSPMHLPVLTAGIICGPWLGALVGILTPILSSLMTGMPAAAYLPSMIFELTMYGLVSGLLFQFVKVRNKYLHIYISLLGAMLAGRLTYGILNALIFRAGAYSMQIWLTSAFVTALPGIAIQLIVIPILLAALEKAKLISL
jgi:niacin transporter